MIDFPQSDSTISGIVQKWNIQMWINANNVCGSVGRPIGNPKSSCASLFQR
jgi:hypothetical protein